MARTIVLVVEDDPMNRLLAVDALERAGFDVADFEDADAAERYAADRSDEIVALVADVQVPGERDGLDLASLFAQRWPDKLVLLTSGCDQAEVMADMPAGVRFLAKSWNAKTLMNCLSAVRPATL